MSYRQYFDIDPEYFPQVDKKIMEEQPELWKKFYPHPSFIELLKTTVNVLKRKQGYKLSVWVDGAYGTGKSHAVLTLKKLLEASEEETRAYFEKYGLNKDLCAELIAQKNEGKIIIAHRYGSSDIENDTDLIVAIQNSVEKALADAGIENKATASMRDSLIRYFENDMNRRAFDIYAKGDYRDVLGGDTADDVLQKLSNYDDDAVRTLIKKLFCVPMVRGSFVMNSGELCDWLREVIEANGLKELIVMWDEFSEYFENNVHHLTGFQQIAELAATAPFCLMIVTHRATAFFSDSDPDKKKTLDRFVDPCHISLPENIAFELMAQGMKVTDDPDLAAKWHKHRNSLDTRTMQSRSAVTKRINVSDKDLQNVLPIHPYAALILQHISVYYTSTARSMFNFIKNDEGDDVHAFQWFIDHFDFSSQNPFLTVDMLWDFFYGKGRDRLAKSIRDILDTYPKDAQQKLIEPEQRVLKVILLLQAISERMSGNKKIFEPNDQNLTLAFEGTDLDFAAVKVAGKLLRDHTITRTPLTGDVFTYCCMKQGSGSIDITPFFPIARAKTTKDMSLMAGSDLRSTVELAGALKLRFPVSYATSSDLDSELKKANNPAVESNKLYAVVTIARDDGECTVIKKKLIEFYGKNPDSRVVTIDASETTLDASEYESFVENFATALAIGASDLGQRKTYESYATEVLKRWAKKIKNGHFYLYSRFNPHGVKVVNFSDLNTQLLSVDKAFYPRCLESEFTSVLNTMFDANSLGAGALCGITEETKGTFRSANEATKLENALREEWKHEGYWKTLHTYTANLKNDVEALIAAKFEQSDRIKIAEIFNALKAEPYGFMPCNLTAFIMGFILKEYANGVYSYSDDLTTIPLDPERLSGMIQEVIKLENTPNAKYKDKYIVTLTEEERAFNKATSIAFDIDERYCVSITDTRSRIRERMKGFSFPIWVINYVLDGKEFKTSKEVVAELIDKFCGIANNKNIEGNMSDNDIALAIGKLCIANPGASEDLKSVLTKDNCKNGMLAYLDTYRGGELPAIAERIGDGGQYINHLGYKFNSDAANWVWNRDTVNEKIDELITEYRIIEVSNRVLSKNVTYRDTIAAWSDKISQIRIAYGVMKNNLDEEVQPFFEMLYQLKRANNLLDSQKEKFLSLLTDNIETFRHFMTHQTDMFRKCCGVYLDELTDEDAEKLLADDSFGLAGAYTRDIGTYTNLVIAAVKKYMSGIVFFRLRRQWLELTGTETPKDWSEKYRMPILAMVPDEEVSMARKAFGAINKKPADETEIEFALDYISKITYLAELNSSASRERAFRIYFLEDYSVLFDDVEKVKEYLRKHVSDEPYYWIANKEVTAQIKSMAQAKYNTSGYDRAKQVIDRMAPDELKKYLKQMIQDNMRIGLEIMKGRD